MNSTTTDIMNKDWKIESIDNFFSRNISGEWGSDPVGINDVLVVGTPDFNNDGTIDWPHAKYRKISKQRLLPRQIFENDILLEKSGGSDDQPAGRVVFCDNGIFGTCSNFVQLLSVSTNYDPKFIFYLLYYHYKRGLVYKYQQKTTGIINFKFNEYFKEKVQVPKLKEQQEQIASILSTIDLSIEKTEQLINKYKSIKQGLMQDLFRYGIDENGSIRSEKTHKFKDSPLGRIPEEWDVVSAISLCDVRDGTHDSPRQSDAGYPLVTSKNITGGSLSLEDTYLISRKDFLLVNKRSQVHKFDLLISMIGTVGEAVLIEEEPQFAIKNVGLFLTGHNVLLGKWIHQYLKTDFAKNFIDQNLKGTSQKYMPLGYLRELPILWPKTKGERIHVIQILDSADKLIKVEEMNKQKFLSIKQGLMQDLLTGKVRVNHLLN